MENIGEQVYVKITHNFFVISCNQIANRDLKLKFISIRKVKADEEKVKHTQRFKDQISLIQQR